MFLQLVTVCILFWSWYIIVSIVTRPWAGWSRVQILARARAHLFAKTYRLPLGPTQSPMQLVLLVLSLVVKWLGCEDDHVPPSSAEVRN
jgi:hypothetical protein